MNASAAAQSGPDIVAETPAHAAALERVLDRAFGPGRLAKASERVREQGAVHRLDLSRVALEAGAPVGCCRMHDIAIGGAPALFLGPLAVDPERQRGGLGANLVAAALDAAKRERKPIILVGAYDFFAPFGFKRVPAGRVAMPGPVDPDRLLWRSSDPNAPESGLADIAGAVTAPPAASRT